MTSGKFLTLRTALKLLPLMVWMGLIFYLSSLPASHFRHTGIESLDRFILSLRGYQLDKIVHALLYFTLAVVSLLAFQKILFINFAICFIYGMSDEVHQLFVPTRCFEVLDLCADAFGVICALLIVRMIARRRHMAFALRRTARRQGLIKPKRTPATPA